MGTVKEKLALNSVHTEPRNCGTHI